MSEENDIKKVFDFYDYSQFPRINIKLTENIEVGDHVFSGHRDAEDEWMEIKVTKIIGNGKFQGEVLSVPEIFEDVVKGDLIELRDYEIADFNKRAEIEHQNLLTKKSNQDKWDELKKNENINQKNKKIQNKIYLWFKANYQQTQVLNQSNYMSFLSFSSEINQLDRNFGEVNTSSNNSSNHLYESYENRFRLIYSSIFEDIIPFLKSGSVDQILLTIPAEENQKLLDILIETEEVLNFLENEKVDLLISMKDKKKLSRNLTPKEFVEDLRIQLKWGQEIIKNLIT